MLYPRSFTPGHKAGSIVRQWSAPRLAAAIENTTNAIRAALREGDTDHALTLVSKNIGHRICAGQIKVRLKPPR